MQNDKGKKIAAVYGTLLFWACAGIIGAALVGGLIGLFVLVVRFVIRTIGG